MRRRVQQTAQEAQGLAEYAIIMALVAIVAIVGLETLGAPTTGLFQRVVAAWP